MVIGVGSLMIFLMIGSMFLGGNEEETEGFNYNGYYFYQVGDFWQVNINDNLMKLQYSPKDVEGLGPSFLGNTKVVYFFYDDESLQSMASFYENIFKMGGYKTGYGCKDNKCEELQPKDCKEFTSALMVYFEYSDSNLVIDKKDNCIVFRGSEEGLSKLGYWFIYKFLGVF